MKEEENASSCNCDGKKQNAMSSNISKSTQTKLTDLELFEHVLSKKLDLSNESKIIYGLALEYINKFHNSLNKQLIHCSDINCGVFKIPEVPNYSFLSDVIMNCFNGAGDNSKELELVNDSQANTNTEISNENVELVKIEIGQKFEEQKCKLENEVNKKSLNLEHHEKEYCGTSNPITDPVYSAITVCKKEDPRVTMNVLEDRHLEECEVNSRFQNKGDAKTNFIKLEQKGSKQSPQDPKNSIKSANSDITQQKLVSSLFSIISIEPQSESHKNEPKHEVYNRDSDYSISDDQEDPLPIKIIEALNEKKVKKGRPENPSKVLEMFDRISPQNLLAKQLSLLQDDLSQKNESIDQENSAKEEYSCSFSDSDSDILDDEDFKTFSRNHTYSKETQIIQENSSADQKRSHPLQLTGKDLSSMSQKMMNAIGLFTANGEIKPAVLNLLEQQKNVRQPYHKKQQFRNTRPINTNLYLNPKPGP